MSGPFTLYRVKPIFEIPRKIELPTCMYKVKNPVARVTDFNEKQENFRDQEILNNIMDKTPIPELKSIEKRWDSIIDQLSDLKNQLKEIKKTTGDFCKLVDYTLVDTETLNKLKAFQGAVINASPSNPPYFLLLLKQLYKSSVPIVCTVYTHSNISSLPDHLNCFNELNTETNQSCLKLHLIWKNDLLDTELIINPIKQLPLKGDVNILRYLACAGLDLLQYSSKDDLLERIKKDEILDNCHILRHTSTAKDRISLIKTLSETLGKSSYFGDSQINICDVAVWSVLKQLNLNVDKELSADLKNWYLKIDELLKN